MACLLVTSGACVWDIGANSGLFSVAAAYHAGPKGYVLAVEADTDAIRLLYRTVQLQPADQCRIEVVPVAVARNPGFVQFAIAKRARAANAIYGYGSTQTGEVEESRTLPAVALDDLLEYFPPPIVLKINVEGAELEVLSGASRVLTQFRPAIHCGVSTQRRDEVSALFQRHGDILFDSASYRNKGNEVIDLCRRNTIPLRETETKT